MQLNKEELSEMLGLSLSLYWKCSDPEKYNPPPSLPTYSLRKSEEENKVNNVSIVGEKADRNWTNFTTCSRFLQDSRLDNRICDDLKCLPMLPVVYYLPSAWYCMCSAETPPRLLPLPRLQWSLIKQLSEKPRCIWWDFLVQSELRDEDLCANSPLLFEQRPGPARTRWPRLQTVSKLRGLLVLMWAIKLSWEFWFQSDGF